MKRLFLVLGGTVTVLFGGWLMVSLYAKFHYDRIRRQAFAPTYTVTPMNEEAESFLSGVQSNWLCKVDVTNGEDVQQVRKLTGKVPSVGNLIALSNYEMPPYDWFSPTANRQSATFALVKALFPPKAMDNTWHLSKDGHVGMLLCRTDMVYLYREEAAGLRATMYIRKKENIEPSASPNTAPPHR